MSKDQGRGGTNSGPQDNDFMDNVLRLICSQGILAQDKVEINKVEDKPENILSWMSILWG